MDIKLSLKVQLLNRRRKGDKQKREAKRRHMTKKYIILKV